MNTQKHFYLTISSGILFVVTYFLSDYLYDKLWIFYLFPMFIIGYTFFAFFILTIKRKHKNGIIAGTIIISILLISILLNSELFASRKVLVAKLTDDLSSINLTLRENNTFEVVASTAFTDETYVGTYQIAGNKIIFKDKRYSNDLIPDTVRIIDNKIIVRFDQNGKPVTDFATFFEITKNEIKKEN